MLDSRQAKNVCQRDRSLDSKDVVGEKVREHAAQVAGLATPEKVTRTPGALVRALIRTVDGRKWPAADTKRLGGFLSARRHLVREGLIISRTGPAMSRMPGQARLKAFDSYVLDRVTAPSAGTPGDFWTALDPAATRKAWCRRQRKDAANARAPRAAERARRQPRTCGVRHFGSRGNECRDPRRSARDRRRFATPPSLASLLEYALQVLRVDAGDDDAASSPIQGTTPRSQH